MIGQGCRSGGKIEANDLFLFFQLLYMVLRPMNFHHPPVATSRLVRHDNRIDNVNDSVTGTNVSLDHSSIINLHTV